MATICTPVKQFTGIYLCGVLSKQIWREKDMANNKMNKNITKSGI